jgi:hypothetical protein
MLKSQSITNHSNASELNLPVLTEAIRNSGILIFAVVNIKIIVSWNMVLCILIGSIVSEERATLIFREQEICDSHGSEY